MDSEKIRELNLRILRLQSVAECTADEAVCNYIAKLIEGLERERDRVHRK